MSIKSKQVVYNMFSAYDKYYEKYNEKKHPLYLSKSKFKDILTEFLKRLGKELITSGKKFILPSNLGHVQIFRMLLPEGYKPIDHHMTKKYGKKIYFNTRITNGYISKVV